MRTPFRNLAPAAGLLLAAIAAGCARESAAPAAGPAPAAAQAPAPQAAPPSATAPAAPPGAQAPVANAASAPAGAPPASAAPVPEASEEQITPEVILERMQRRSPSAALVETFNAACAEPRRSAVARAAKRLDFTPIAAEAPRETPAGAAAAVPEDGEAWRGPDEVGGAVLVWDAATSTCEMRAAGVDLLLVESAFSRLPQALEEEGSSVMRLTPPSTSAGGVRTRQVLLVQPGRFSRPERARVLRLGHHLGGRAAAAAEPGGDTVTLSARAVSAPR